MMNPDWEKELENCGFESPRNENQNSKQKGCWSDDEDDIFDKNLLYAPVK